MSRTPHLEGSNSFWFLGMMKETLRRRSAIVSCTAVEQFAATANNTVHDRQWAKCQAPNPNKEIRNFPVLLA